MLHIGYVAMQIRCAEWRPKLLFVPLYTTVYTGYTTPLVYNGTTTQVFTYLYQAQVQSCMGYCLHLGMDQINIRWSPWSHKKIVMESKRLVINECLIMAKQQCLQHQRKVASLSILNRRVCNQNYIFIFLHCWISRDMSKSYRFMGIFNEHAENASLLPSLCTLLNCRTS